MRSVDAQMLLEAQHRYYQERGQIVRDRLEAHRRSRREQGLPEYSIVDRVAQWFGRLAVVLLGLGLCSISIVIVFDLSDRITTHLAITPYILALIGMSLIAVGGRQIWKALKRRSEIGLNQRENV